ncbi:hypothetical protein D3C75_744160 [compost metagenome]
MSVEQGEIFRTRQDIPAFVAVILRAVADYGAFAVFRAVRRFDDDFGFTVAVQIIHHQLGIMRSRADVDTQIDSPEPRAVKFNGVDIDIAGIAGLRIVFRVARAP